MSDSGTEYSSVYSYDTDAEYDEQIPVIQSDDNEEVPDDTVFPTTCCISLRFCLRDGVRKDGTVTVVVPAHSFVRFLISTPLKRTGELELQLEGNLGADLSRLEITLSRRNSSNYYQMDRQNYCALTQEAVLNYLKSSSSIQKNHHRFLLHDRIGMKITRNGDLEMFISGKSQGTVAEAIYKLGRNVSYYAVLNVPPGLSLNLTAGGKSLLIAIFFSETSYICPIRVSNLWYRHR